jgi:hypothetical protein
MEIILERSRAWDGKKVYRFYKNKNFIQDFVDAFSSDDEVKRFVYANAFYLRVRYEGKAIFEKIPDSEIGEIIMEEYNEFMDSASDAIRYSSDADDMFNFIVCDGIYNEMDAVMSLRDELMCSFDGASGMYFHSNEMDDFSEEMSGFFKYDPKKHVGKKFKVYKDWIMAHNDALSFIGGSMYLQEIIDPENEMNFDIFYEYLSDFISSTLDCCNIDAESNITKTTFVRDLKKIFKFIYRTNRDLSLS